MAESCEGQTLEEDIMQRFRDITVVDVETALRFLDANNWDIDEAINTYFATVVTSISHAGSEANPVMILDSPEGVTRPQESEVTGPQESNHTQLTANSCMKLLSWNIDGLSEEQIRERTRYVCHLIKTRQPDVVYLQEVIEVTLSVFQRVLPEYLVLHDTTKPKPGYFNIMLLKQATMKPQGELQCKHFSTSKMGRHLLIQPAQFCDQMNIILMTSHLESTKECQAERKNQLKEVFGEMSSQNPEHLVIFGGDTNLRDFEVKAVGLPSQIEDLWEKCGSGDSTKYTWDTSVNDNLHIQGKSKLRFDRIYLRTGGWRARSSLVPASFSLVGKERLASGCFASDHWGIWCEFKHVTA